MSRPHPILIARNDRADLHLLPGMANRHGLIAGATGTGKTITLQTLAESFSAQGVPVFLADVKGDLSGLALPGGQSPKVQERIRQLRLDGYTPAGCPVTFWDVFGAQGHPVRATVSELGPLLLARLLNLNDTQAGVLNLVFRIADEHGLLLLDLKDLRAMLNHVGENAAAFTTQYGNISAASIGAIQRGLLALESQGGDRFFGEPALNLDDLLQTDPSGRGVVNILAADKLMAAPKVYATLLLWMLSELFENLPEVGDAPKPKLVFFFDEAHLLFNDLPPALLERIEQVLRLIRSKGVGVFFATQNAAEVPEKVLAQLGNRVQHALRAFTPADQKLVRAAAQTFRANPALDTEAVLTQLGVGEALVSLLDERGQPGVVERAFIVPPRSQVGPIPPEQRRRLITESLVAGVYEEAVDRESAYEILTGSVAARAGKTEAPPVKEDKPGFFGSIFGGGGAKPAAAPAPRPLPTAPRRGGRRTDSFGTVLAKSATRTVTTAVVGTITRQIMRGVLGGILGGGRRR
ncbi:MAG: helicase HerA-like domain-containing protein [Limisphaerales bacterium]